MGKFERVTINHQNQLSDLKDSPDPTVGSLKIDVRSDLGPIKNKYRSVHTSTMLVNKAPSCLGCPTPSSLHNDDKNGGVEQVNTIPQEFNPVITQSSCCGVLEELY